MAKLISDLQVDLADRLGENGVPASATELSKRRRWFIKGLQFVLTEKPMWFTEKQFTAIPSIIGTSSYSFPTTCRQITKIMFQGIQYDKAPFDEVYDRFERGTSFVAPGFLTEKAYYVRGEVFTMIPTPSVVADITVYGYENPTMPSAEGSGIIIPDNYSDLLVAFAEGRYWSSAHKRAKASDAFGEFADWVEKLKLENMRRRFGEK